MVHFLTRHGPFAAKLAQMNLKESDKCKCGSAQTTKHLWESCTKSELKHLYDTEPNLTKILQEKDKRKEFQFLAKEMKKRLKDEEYQSKTRTRAIDPHDEKQVFNWLKSNTTQRRSSWTADQHWLAG
ncbi:hypothetical protein HN011_009116 [Eciton burchellii]|nr:hypothetical protein HN011_009116 [Eciton burchellii]